jgi:hypothetical protein
MKVGVPAVPALPQSLRSIGSRLKGGQTCFGHTLPSVLGAVSGASSRLRFSMRSRSFVQKIHVNIRKFLLRESITEKRKK